MRHYLLSILLFFISQTFFSQETKADSSHSPKKATTLSAIVPGVGQIYNNIHKPKSIKNKLWWKLPLIYGGLGTATFFVFDNNTQFNSFKNERLYRQETGLFDLYPEYTSDQLKVIQEDYRRWRDLSVISFIGVYLLQLVDANVEGHLIHFDNSDDLSLLITPKISTINHVSYTQLNFLFRF